MHICNLVFLRYIIASFDFLVHTTKKLVKLQTNKNYTHLEEMQMLHLYYTTVTVKKDFLSPLFPLWFLLTLSATSLYTTLVILSHHIHKRQESKNTSDYF